MLTSARLRLIFTTMQPANVLSGEELACSSENFNQRRTRWWAAVRSTHCPCPATVLNLGSNQRKWSRNARYEGHMSLHPMYSRPAPTVCDEVNRSWLHMSSLPSFSFTNSQATNQTTWYTQPRRVVSCCPEEQPPHGFHRMALMVSSSLIQISLDTHVGAELMLIEDEEKIISYNSIPLFEK